MERGARSFIITGIKAESREDTYRRNSDDLSTLFIPLDAYRIFVVFDKRRPGRMEIFSEYTVRWNKRSRGKEDRLYKLITIDSKRRLIL